MAPELVIAAAARVIDGEGSLSEVIEARERLEDRGARVGEYRIAPLRFGWDAPLPDGYLKSACAPIEGLLAARESIADGALDAVLISGADPIKSAFAGRPEERDRLMRVYGERTFLSAFDELAGALRARLSMTEGEFEELAECLFENYWTTWTTLDPNAERPDAQWFAKVTPHFRGVDCANPNADFEGTLLVTTTENALAAGFEPARTVVVRGMSLKQQCDDGIEHIPEIVSYEHLRAAYDEACQRSGLNFSSLLLDGRARVEVYTCFPVVPIAFFLATGLARDTDHLKQLLGEHPATISGGLNLARAPWNNSTLSALVQATEMVRDGTPIIGIHSNAALGYKQGFAVLTAPGDS
jgi:hypothetical protein